MRLLQLVSSLMLLAAGAAQAASSTTWTFDDATVSVNRGKGTNKGEALKEKYVDANRAMSADRGTLLTLGFAPHNHRFDMKGSLKKAVKMSTLSDTAKIFLTAKNNGKGTRPHQAFLLLRDPTTNLEAPFLFTTKENGKCVATIVSCFTDLYRQIWRSLNLGGLAD